MWTLFAMELTFFIHTRMHKLKNKLKKVAVKLNKRKVALNSRKKSNFQSPNASGSKNTSKQAKKRALKRRNREDSDCQIVENSGSQIIELDDDDDDYFLLNNTDTVLIGDSEARINPDTESTSEYIASLFYEDRQPVGADCDRPLQQQPPAYNIGPKPLGIAADRTNTMATKRRNEDDPRNDAKRVAIDDRHSDLAHSIMSTRRLSNLYETVSDISLNNFDSTITSIDSSQDVISSTPIQKQFENNLVPSGQESPPFIAKAGDAANVQKSIRVSLSSQQDTAAKRTCTITSGGLGVLESVKNAVTTNSMESNSSSGTMKTDETVINKKNSFQITIQNDFNANNTEKRDASGVMIIPDADDSVIFVSETQHQSRPPPQIFRTFGSNYVRFGASTSGETTKRPQSVRAKRNAEKRKGKSKLNTVNKRNGIQRGGAPLNMERIRLGVKAVVGTDDNTNKNPIGSKKNQNIKPISPKKNPAKNDNKPRVEAAVGDSSADGNLLKRMVIIDGNNVAYGYGQNQFSVKGLQLCIEHFEKEGHEVVAVVPQMRLKRNRSTDPELLEELVRKKKVLLTPCKSLPGEHSISYDDRFIMDMAADNDAVVISNDNYKDLLAEKATWTEIIRTRVIGFTWCRDKIYLPNDPYGKNGPNLKDVLYKKAPEVAE